MTAPAEDRPLQQPLDPGTFARYAIHDPREILQLLHSLVDKQETVAAYVDGGPWFATKLLAIDDDGGTLILDAPADEAVAALAGKAAQITCTTRLDKVNVQFAVAAPAHASHDGRAALRVEVPESVIRLQRREFFRLPTPQSEPVMCSITQVEADGKKKTLAVRIMDISGGGLAIVVPPAEFPFEPGMEFNQCHLELPDNEPLQVGLKVRNVYSVARPDGTSVTRAGCEFFGLSRQMMARLQRYMFRLERSLRV